VAIRPSGSARDGGCAAPASGVQRGAGGVLRRPRRAPRTEAAELIDHRRLTPARYKVPVAVFIDESLPKNPIGKNAKGPVRERVSTPTAGAA
jgi:hypothetical protein